MTEIAHGEHRRPPAPAGSRSRVDRADTRVAIATRRGARGRACSPCRSSPAARCCRTCSSSSPCWRWRNTGTCSPAMPGWSRSASRPSSGSAPTRSSRATLIGQPRSADRHPARRRRSRLLLALPTALRRVPPARRLFRHRHLGGGRGVPAAARAGEAARRRHRHVARTRHHQRDGRPRHGSPTSFGVRIAAARDIATYWLALALARRHARAGLLPAPLARAAWRSPRSATRRRPRTASASTPFAPSSWSMCCAAFGTGMIGALIYLQKARISPDAAFSVLDWTAYVIFIVVIGGIGTIEGPIIGAIVLYLLQDYLATLRRLVPDAARRARHRRHAGRAGRHLGFCGAALRPADLSGAAATKDHGRMSRTGAGTRASAMTTP